MTPEDRKHLESVVRHISNVRDNCVLMGTRLIESGNEQFGRQLIALGHIHDYSKLDNRIEWLYLRESEKDKNKEMFEAAYISHVSSNPHHPEYWGGITEMPPIYLAEMVCDTAARGAEFGTDYRTWLKEKASKKYEFSLKGKVYKALLSYTDLLLDKPFK